MKLLKRIKAPTAPKRLLSVLPTAATLLTAFVSLPVALPVTAATGAPYTAEQIDALWDRTGLYATQSDGIYMKPDGSHYKVQNSDLSPCDFSGLTSQSNLWLNDYGYAASTAASPANP